MSTDGQPKGIEASSVWIQKMFEDIKGQRLKKLLKEEKIPEGCVKKAEAQFKELKSSAERTTVSQMAAKFDPKLQQREKFKDLQRLISIVDKYEEENTSRQLEFDKLVKMYSSATTETEGEGKPNEKQNSKATMPTPEFSKTLPVSHGHLAVPDSPNMSLTLSTPPFRSRSRQVKRNHSGRKRLSMTVRASTTNVLPESNDDVVTITKEHYNRLTQTEQLQKEKIDELTNRLSKIVSERMTEGNPTITDLSDKNRPTKIGENFGQLYDDEWSEAFEDLQGGGYEVDCIIKELATVVRLAYAFCKEVAEQQIITLKETMETAMRKPKWSKDGQFYSVEDADIDMDSLSLSSCHKHAKNFRKEAALASVTPACTIFKDGKLKAEVKWDPYSGSLSEYVDKCVELTWLMCVQDPPMALIWQDQGDKVNKKCFRFFQRKGDFVEYIVWPGVLLHENGPLVVQGHVFPVEKD